MIVQLGEDIQQDNEHSWHSFPVEANSCSCSCPLTCTLQLLLLCVFLFCLELVVNRSANYRAQISSTKNRNSPTYRTFGWSLSDITCHTTSADKRNEKKSCFCATEFRSTAHSERDHPNKPPPTELTKLNPKSPRTRLVHISVSRRQKQQTNQRTNSHKHKHKHANTSSIKAVYRRQPSSANKEEGSTQFFSSPHKHSNGEKPTLWETTTQYREILLLYFVHTHTLTLVNNNYDNHNHVITTR